MAEDRTCILCGKQVDAGMTNNEGIYAHEECFEDMMNTVYPYGWRPNPSGELGSHGGYYQAKELPADDWHDTGVFYTELEKGE